MQEDPILEYSVLDLVHVQPREKCSHAAQALLGHRLFAVGLLKVNSFVSNLTYDTLTYNGALRHTCTAIPGL